MCTTIHRHWIEDAPVQIQYVSCVYCLLLTDTGYWKQTTISEKSSRKEDINGILYLHVVKYMWLMVMN